MEWVVISSRRQNSPLFCVFVPTYTVLCIFAFFIDSPFWQRTYQISKAITAALNFYGCSDYVIIAFCVWPSLPPPKKNPFSFWIGILLLLLCFFLGYFRAFPSAHWWALGKRAQIFNLHLLSFFHIYPKSNQYISVPITVVQNEAKNAIFLVFWLAKNKKI